MPSDPEASSLLVHPAPPDSSNPIPAQDIESGHEPADQVPRTRDDIDLAYEQIDRDWRDTPHRQPLIAKLTALDWQVRTLDHEHPTDQALLHRISVLRSQIWLSQDH